MFRFRKQAAILCVLCLLVMCFAGCSDQEEAPAREERSAQTAGASSFAQIGGTTQRTGMITAMGLDDDGNFQILRDVAKSEPMGEAGTWTIFVYLCGSNLESDWGCATDDLLEMIDGSEGSAVRYVILTGGSLEWQNTIVDSEALEIYLVEDGDISLVESADYNYMNDPDTLQDFLSWGVENYPAAKMGLIFWDHGGGSLDGVCMDEWFQDDIDSGILEDISDYPSTLTLSGISGALSQVCADMTDQFEFVGYDACLMGTLENAFMLSRYARYMYASEEEEPGGGWDYVAIGEAIGASGQIDGATLGKVICDSYYESCVEDDSEENATFACIDLRKIDDLVLTFDKFARNMLSASEDPSTLASIVKHMGRVEFFGGNSEDEGYFNMVDLAGALRAASFGIPGSQEVLDALSRAVVYTRNGLYHEDACGLAMYYPLHVEPGSGELGRFAQIAVSPYYYGYVAQNAYAAANGGLEGYDFQVSLNAWASAVDDELEDIIEDYGDPEVTGESPYVVFWDEPQLLEDGSYGFSLTEESLPYISSVEADIFFLSDDGEDIVYLGSTTDILADWDEGIFLDNFDGLWFCMPDDQLVSAIVVSETEDYAIYTTPVLLNGKECNLRFVVDYSDYSVTLDGVWDGADENGLAGKHTYELKPGDVIQPLFQAANLETEEEYLYYGEEYVYDGSDTWYYTTLFDADYLYQFCIYDIYGDNYTTDGVFFSVEDGEIYFDLDQ